MPPSEPGASEAGPAGRPPVVTWVFAALCLLVSVPAMFFPSLYHVLGGLKPLASPWQRLVLAFQHGFPGFPAPVHLAFNLALLGYLGPRVERILGHGRFALLTVAAMGTYAVAHLCPLVDGHGASGVIWAYAPVIFLDLRRRWRTDRDAARMDPEFQGGRGMLLIMWGAVTIVMAGIAYGSGYRGNPVYTVLLGNIFHVTATVTGLAFAFAWRRRILAAAPA
jgi:membrane associated rhomboid family serine protease